MPERFCWKAVTHAPTPSRPGPATLPPDLLQAGARRLGNLSLLVAGVCLTFSVLDRYLVMRSGRTLAEAHQTISMLCEIGLVAVSLGMFALSRRKDLDPAEYLDRGLVFQVVFALLLAIGHHCFPYSVDTLPRGWTPVATWIIAFPLLVPATRGKALVATLASAAMDPIGLLVDVASGLPLPPPVFMAQLFLPTAVAVVAALVATRILYDLTADVSKAREMGSYRLVSLIGRGGMGEVWQAEHRMLARPAAIKLIRTDGVGLAAKELLARFEREAKATAALRCLHTVQIYDFGLTDEGAFYSVMELLQGYTLEELVERFGPLPPERVAHILRQVCCSLGEAHQRGLVHRDIKPGNVFVCCYSMAVDWVKVLDFGLVKEVTTGAAGITQTGFLTGTPSYMPPEQALGKREIDGRADLYALGCVGYFLLTGDTVFPKRTPIEVIHDHAMTPAPRPSTKSDRPIPAALEEILMACLEKDPDRRPESARELEKSLASLGLEPPWSTERAEAWWTAHPVGPVRSAPEPTSKIA